MPSQQGKTIQPKLQAIHMNIWITNHHQYKTDLWMVSLSSDVIKTIKFYWTHRKFYGNDRQLHKLNEYYCENVCSSAYRKYNSRYNYDNSCIVYIYL